MKILKAIIGFIVDLFVSKPTLKIRPNPEWTPEKVAEYKETIRKNGGYCPCASPCEDTKCMCKSFREKTDAGLCHCELYQKYFA